MSEPLNMTDGERMVWAAAYAAGLLDAVDVPVHGLARYACNVADRSVIALRFGGDGPGRAEMCDLDRVGGV